MKGCRDESDLPAEIHENGWGDYLGRTITSEDDWTITTVGDCIPVDPPIEAPAGSRFVIGGDLIGEGTFAHYNTIAMYVDGQRVNQYRYHDGKFAPAGERMQG